MTETPIPEPAKETNDRLDACVGLMVVLIATFIGLCNVKDDNIVQQMQMKQVERNDNWAWFQARNIRQAVYEGVSAELAVPWPNETPASQKARESVSAEYLKKSRDQEMKAEKQKSDAESAQKEYDKLNDKDDQFDLCDAMLAISLALMGVTALTKKWWLFFVALVPAVFGFYMGMAGFLGLETDYGPVKALIRLLS